MYDAVMTLCRRANALAVFRARDDRSPDATMVPPAPGLFIAMEARFECWRWWWCLETAYGKINVESGVESGVEIGLNLRLLEKHDWISRDCYLQLPRVEWV